MLDPVRLFCAAVLAQPEKVLPLQSVVRDPLLQRSNLLGARAVQNGTAACWAGLARHDGSQTPNTAGDMVFDRMENTLLIRTVILSGSMLRSTPADGAAAASTPAPQVVAFRASAQQ